MKIGLLGGSFNPAHDGHLHISEIALKTLGLMQVWWLVSPQNPLKSRKDMMSLKERMASAKAVTRHNPQIRVTDIEVKLRTQYTADTLMRLKLKYPQHEFFWLMGADNLVQLPKWKKWQKIIKLAEIHVFDRSDYLYKGVKGRAFSHYPHRIKYHHIRKHPASATEIRKSKQKLTIV